MIIAGPWALAYIPLFVLATLPGWPLGRVLFGRHPAGWVAGALLGYGITCIAFWSTEPTAYRFWVPTASSHAIMNSTFDDE